MPGEVPVVGSASTAVADGQPSAAAWRPVERGALAGGNAVFYCRVEAAGVGSRATRGGSVLASQVSKALHRIYRSRRSEVAAGARAMEAFQRQFGNLLGGDPVPTTPDPLFIERRGLSVFSQRLERLVAWLEAVAGHLALLPDMPEVVGLDPLHAELIAKDAGLPARLLPIARVDGMIDAEERFRVVEVNTDGSTGIHDAWVLGEAARRLPALESLRAEFRPAPLPLYDHLARAILEAHQEQGGEGLPQVAIVDWDHVKTRHEQVALVDRLSERGIPTRWIDPRWLRIKGGRLVDGEGPIDILYKRVLTSELLEARKEPGVKAWFTAYLDDLVCQINPFAADLVFDKGFLAFAQDPRLLARASPEMRRLVGELLPETRIYPGDGGLEDWVRRERKRLVLKPRREYGGRGVVLGPFATEAEWEGALALADRTGGYLAQEYVEAPALRFWVVDEEGRANPRELFTTLGTWVFSGKVRGFYYRAGPKRVINVSGGARSIPVLAVDVRPRPGRSKRAAPPSSKTGKAGKKAKAGGQARPAKGPG